METLSCVISYSIQLLADKNKKETKTVPAGRGKVHKNLASILCCTFEESMLELYDRHVDYGDSRRKAVYMDREDIEYRQQIVNTYKPDVERLIRYLPWLEEKAGSSVQETFEGSGIKGSSITFPVYDGTLMSFIKEVQRTGLLDRNYPYIYSRHRLRTVKDELRAIEQTGIREMDVLKGILSRYVLGGMTKGRLWTEAVYNRIFLNVVRKMKENLEFWDKPMR